MNESPGPIPGVSIRALTVAALCLTLGSAAAAPAAVVVEGTGADSAAAKAGIQPGDVLLRWQRAAAPPANPEPARGELGSPFDVHAVEHDQARRGTVSIALRRRGEEIVAVPPAGAWKLETRPQLSEPDLDGYLDGKRQLEEHGPEAGLGRWREMAERSRQAGDHELASWLFYRMAIAGGTSEAAMTAGSAAIGEARAAGNVPRLVALINLLAESLTRGGELERSQEMLLAAIEDGKDLESTNLNVATSFHLLGVISWRQGELTAAEGYLQRSLKIRQRLAPGSLAVAASLRNLGIVAGTRRDLDQAAECFQRSLAIKQRLTPGSLALASEHNNLGYLAYLRDDFDVAEHHFRRALTLTDRLDPGSDSIASYLSGLGATAEGRGDLAAAESYLTRAVTIERRAHPQSLPLAIHLGNLGHVVFRQHDFGTAEKYLREAQAIYEGSTRLSTQAATNLDVLGAVARARGDLDAAEAYHRRGLEIRQRETPDSTHIAESFQNLGTVALERGRLSEARDLFERAALLWERHLPGHLQVADTRVALARVARREGRLQEAEEELRKALAIRGELAPETAQMAEALYLLATLERQKGRLDAALETYRQAIGALEAQRRRLGGSEEFQADFAAPRAAYYRDYLDLLVEQDRAVEAFHVLERFRARRFLDLLAERRPVFATSVPEELARDRRRLDADYDRTLLELAKLSADGDEEEREKLRRQLDELRHRRREMVARIRTASPRLAGLEYPEPIDLREAERVLDPGTLLLSYSIGDESSYLLALGPEPGELETLRLTTDQETLRREVERFRTFLRPGQTAKTVLFQASGLTRTLLAPVAERIARAKRLLVLPDGPLYHLPFAALADPSTPGGRRHLVDAVPLSLASSMTVFAELEKRRRPREEIRLSAFGDPQYPGSVPDGPSAPVLRATLDHGLRLTPLPATRTELESLRALFPETSRLYLGPEATEERVRALGADSNIVHFACHGLVNERFPLESALALAIPEEWSEGQENGLLQVWEIFEKLRLDADLVTLSACETARGKELTGEGILGLTRAFQYAGARSVVASLWGISDTNTAELMKRFYRYLKEGRSKDQALRAAQLDLLRGHAGSDAENPFYWAAFVLQGDWR